MSNIHEDPDFEKVLYVCCGCHKAFQSFISKDASADVRMKLIDRACRKSHGDGLCGPLRQATMEEIVKANQ